MWSLWALMNRVFPGRLRCAAPAPPSFSGTPPAVTSGTVSFSRPGQNVRLSICSRAALICCPTPPCNTWKPATGGRNTCSLRTAWLRRAKTAASRCRWPFVSFWKRTPTPKHWFCTMTTIPPDAPLWQPCRRNYPIAMRFWMSLPGMARTSTTPSGIF